MTVSLFGYNKVLSLKKCLTWFNINLICVSTSFHPRMILLGFNGLRTWVDDLGSTG